jgi:hypothetical protein
MSTQDAHTLELLATGSAALRELLGAIIRSEQRYSLAASPLALLDEITTNSRWRWLQPLYQLIADIDHAAHEAELPATEVAAIGAYARGLLAGTAPHADDQFLARYRALLQSNAEIAVAHGAALRALRKLPPEPDTEAERLHAHHQWTMRRKHLRGQA